jgi:transcriptional regulator with PAS, ATPase and Fis domain
VKGSYTGAINDSPGYFGVANKGTLFLDEVGELPLATQARLLRVLETGEYIPVGGTDIRKTDVRIVAATNLNIRQAISEGRFREDLYYRLNSIPIQMPPLRERGEDIVLLFRLFAMQMAEKYRMDRITLDEDAKQLLMRYKWPGNVRQLKNITEQISVLSPDRRITAQMLSQFIPQDQESTQLATIHREGGDHSFENEREILYKILFELRGNVNDMRREMSALKKQIDEVQGGAKGAQVPQVPVDLQNTQLAPIQPIQTLSPAMEDAVAEEYVEPEREPETLNLNHIGRQMLEKALERNHGNRKKAAQELGISDRTLYRRLKQYGLDK